MIKRFLLVICTGCALKGDAQTQFGGPFELTVSMTHMPDSVNAILHYNQGDVRRSDTVTALNGTFIFKGRLQEPAEAMVTLKKQVPSGAKPVPLSPKYTFEFYLTPGKAHISATDSLKNAHYKGSSPYLKEFAAFTEGVKNYRQEYILPLYAKRNNGEDTQEVKRKIDSLNKELKEITLRKFLIEHASSPVAFVAFKRYAGMIMNDSLEALFHRLSPAVQALPGAKRYHEMFNALHRIYLGAKAPEIAAPDARGKMVTLADYKGQYVLIDFWASWCGPCRKENPGLIATYKKFKDQNFIVLGVSVDNQGTKAAWLKAIQEDGLLWTNISDLKGWNEGIAKLYGINKVPQNFLIDPSGKVIAINIHGDALIQKLKELL